MIEAKEVTIVGEVELTTIEKINDVEELVTIVSKKNAGFNTASTMVTINSLVFDDDIFIYQVPRNFVFKISKYFNVHEEDATLLLAYAKRSFDKVAISNAEKVNSSFRKITKALLSLKNISFEHLFCSLEAGEIHTIEGLEDFIEQEEDEK